MNFIKPEEMMEQLYKQVIETCGAGRQVDKAIEECSELITALIKYLNQGANLQDVITELADVSIMTEQMALLFGLSDFKAEKKKKLKRLKERLKNNEL